MTRPQALALLGELCAAERPRLHFRETALQDWGLEPSVLRWLFDHVGEGARTVETGCGHSTLVFALRGAEHTVISPDPIEHERVQRWCDEHGVPVDRVRFVAGRSQDVFPGLDVGGPIDVAVIDGDHAFPIPFIDWYHLAARLGVHGLLVIDDVDVPTGRLLVEFLEAESGRWVRRARFPRTVVFEKTAVDVTDLGFWEQPWTAERSLPLDERWRELRNRVRLRSRLRAIAGRRRAAP
jgi:hypothetical protein